MTEKPPAASSFALERAALVTTIGALRAENERLNVELSGVLGGQVEQLQASVAYVNELRAENERLRAALEIAKGECEGYVLMQIEDVLSGKRPA